MHFFTNKKHLLMAFVLVVLTIGDLWSKHWMSGFLALGESKSVIPGFFQLTLVHNTGAAFGIGAKWSTPFFVVSSLIAMAVVSYIFFRLKPGEELSRWGLVLIMSGALGNLIDRLRFGYVVDFLDVFVGKYHWPAFNVADSAITVGAVLFAIDLIWPPKGKTGNEPGVQ